MDKGTPIKYRYSRGLVALMSVIALPFILLVVGLSVDAGRAYIVKSKLFAAVDAASIAAARAVANGEDAGVPQLKNILPQISRPTFIQQHLAWAQSISPMIHSVIFRLIFQLRHKCPQSFYL
ncbi:pilus assembly protein TadG-related protein [Vibrio lentus]|nr:pilus assembly protein TadG-related protein [Vibrio lentus]